MHKLDSKYFKRTKICQSNLNISRQIRSGFTLLELLIVIAIVSILMGALFYNSFRLIQANRLREAAQQIVADLQRARSQAQLTSENSQVALCSTISTTCSPAAGNTVYTTRWGSGGTGPGSGTKQLPYGITVTSVTAGTGKGYLQYSAPNAETDATGPVWQVNSPTAGVRPLFIKVVGVTGKVILSAVN